MDISYPPVEKQVSPPPWIAYRRHWRLEDLIQQALREQPDATPNEVAAKIAKWGYDAPGIWIARKMQSLKIDAVPASSAEASPPQGNPPHIS